MTPRMVLLTVIAIVVVVGVLTAGMITAALLERRRNRAVLGDERALDRDPDPDHGPAEPS